MFNHNDFIKQTAQLIIDQLKKGTAPWQKSWKPVSSDQFDDFLPRNATTNVAYSGINTLILLIEQAAHGYKDNRWLTFKQAAKLHGRVKKGARGTRCMHWTEIQLNDIDEDTGKRKRRMVPCSFVVFNVEQVEGLNLQEIERPKVKWTPIESAEHIIEKSHATINHVFQNSAYYAPELDTITVPDRAQFNTASDYYDTVLHEMGHWTGHKDRLNRDLTGSFGSKSYAKEELRAEIASMMVAMSINLPHNVDSHASYVKGWIEVLEDDPKEIFRAASAAGRIHQYLMKYL